MPLVISDKCKYIFFHIPKNAGVSVSNILMNNEKKLKIKHFLTYFTPYLWGRNNNFYISKNDNKLVKFNSHITCYDFFNLFQKNEFENYFKFAIVRNPYDRAVSRYVYSKQVSNKFKNFTFNEFLEYDFKHNLKVLDQFTFCTKDQKNICLDKILKFEKLDEVMDLTFRFYEKKIKPKHLNQTKKKAFQEFYDFSSKQIIKKFLSKDLEYFGYDFE